jgi:hypothetical protein
MDWFCLKPRELWGGYGDVLISGFYTRAKGGPLRLHRAGPFLPPLSFPWGASGNRIVVSDGFREALVRGGFVELVFREASKDRIVALSWHR